MKRALAALEYNFLIDVPGASERRTLLKRYKKKYLDDYATEVKDTRSYLEMLYKKNPARAPLLMERAVSGDSFWNALAEKLDGFVGRDISDLCLAIQHAGLNSRGRMVTEQIVNQVVQEQTEQMARKKLRTKKA